MKSSPLFDPRYRAKFSGHETFPMRYGWLKKAFDAVLADEGNPNKRIFSSDDAIAFFGVGKNMVTSIRHWALATNVIEEESPGDRYITTKLGKKLFRDKGLDPFMEHPATQWLLHWQLAGNPDKTTWYWVFNHFASPTFHRDNLIKGIGKLAEEQGWSRAVATTITNDVACFLRTYLAHQPTKRKGLDDTLESPLAELGLIKSISSVEGYRFVRSAKPTLGLGVFAYALVSFWARKGNATTLSFEAVAHEWGSPGRVFLLDENEIVDRLTMLEDFTSGGIRWSETAGLRQLVRTQKLEPDNALKYIESDYSTEKVGKAR